MRRVTIALFGAAVLASGLLGGSSAPLHPSVAHADADPPSDILPLQDVYFPYRPPVSGKLKAQLNKLAAEGKKAGFPLKVALIGTQVDLGGVPQLFGKPAEYAKFLGNEISFNRKQPVIIVMPQGFGAFKAGPRASAVANHVKIAGDASSNPDSLAVAAILAYPKVAAAAGHPVAAIKPADSKSGGGGGGGGTPVWVFVIPVLLLAVGGALAFRRGHEDDDADQEAAA